MTGLPNAFTERMGRQLGKGLQDFLRAMEEAPVRGIRMNVRKPFEGADDFTAGERIPWAEDGYYLPADSIAGATIFHEAGAFYLQEPAAMLPAEVLNPQPGETILDLCAAPGGKSTQIGLKMAGEGLLISNEPVPKRAAILSRNMERMGIPNSVVISTWPEKIPGSWDGLFDGVLADVPCSGEGMFRREPETRAEWSPEKAAGCAKRQAEILEEAARLVRDGGRLVYSTCTYNPEETEENVLRFLKKHPEFEPESFSLPGAESRNGMLLCLPHQMKGEGQFAALLRKKGSGESRPMQMPFDPATKEELKLLQETIPGIREANRKIGNTLIRIPACPELKGIRVIRAGLQIAEIRGKNLIPDHAAALCFAEYGLQCAELDADTAQRYIAGEEIPGEAKGWVILKYRGIAVGWGKGSSGTIKNHYPKGLRKDRILTNP